METNPIRDRYIRMGLIKPNFVPVESAKCRRCWSPFDRLVGYNGYVFCGICRPHREGEEQ